MYRRVDYTFTFTPCLWVVTPRISTRLLPSCIPCVTNTYTHTNFNTPPTLVGGRRGVPSASPMLHPPPVPCSLQEGTEEYCVAHAARFDEAAAALLASDKRTAGSCSSDEEGAALQVCVRGGGRLRRGVPCRLGGVS